MKQENKALEILSKVAALLQQHQREDKKILAGYTLAANLGEDATELTNEIARFFSSISKDPAPTPSQLPETETGVKQDWEAFENEINDLEADLWNQPTGAPPTPGNERKDSGEGFTPGPWLIEENTNHFPFVMGEDNNLIAMLIDGKDGSLFYGRSLEETKANSRLIASAPDMLKIVKRAHFWFSNEANYPEGTGGYKMAKECEAILNSITGGK